MNVPGDNQEVGIAVNMGTVKPPLEKVSDALISAVHVLGVSGIQALYGARQSLTFSKRLC